MQDYCHEDIWNVSDFTHWNHFCNSLKNKNFSAGHNMKINEKKIRYAVVPLVSDDDAKLKELSKKYKTEINCHYE